MKKERTIPVQIAKLIIGYLQNTLTEQEHLELVKWFEISDANLELFEDLSEGNDDNVFTLNDLIIETDELLDDWMVAGLIAREMENAISDDEKIVLKGWIDISGEHKRRYEFLSNR